MKDNDCNFITLTEELQKTIFEVMYNAGLHSNTLEITDEDNYLTVSFNTRG